MTETDDTITRVMNNQPLDPVVAGYAKKLNVLLTSSKPKIMEFKLNEATDACEEVAGVAAPLVASVTAKISVSSGCSYKDVESLKPLLAYWFLEKLVKAEVLLLCHDAIDVTVVIRSEGK